MAAMRSTLEDTDFGLLIDVSESSLVASGASESGSRDIVDSRHIHPLHIDPQPYPTSLDGCWYCDWCSRTWHAPLCTAPPAATTFPDCAERRYDGALAEEGEANMLTAVHADVTVCKIGLSGEWSVWWGRHYRCSLDKQCSYKLCAHCFDGPTPKNGTIPSFADTFGAPFTACTAALIDSRLQQLIDADDEQLAAVSHEQTGGHSTTPRPTSLQRRCCASQWQLLDAASLAETWHAVLGTRHDFIR